MSTCFFPNPGSNLQLFLEATKRNTAQLRNSTPCLSALPGANLGFSTFWTLAKAGGAVVGRLIPTFGDEVVCKK